MTTQIRTLEELFACTVARQSVVVPSSNAWKGPRPAAVLINQQGLSLLHCFRLGMYVYERNQKGESK